MHCLGNYLLRRLKGLVRDGPAYEPEEKGVHPHEPLYVFTQAEGALPQKRERPARADCRSIVGISNHVSNEPQCSSRRSTRGDTHMRARAKAQRPVRQCAGICYGQGRMPSGSGSGRRRHHLPPRTSHPARAHGERRNRHSIMVPNICHLHDTRFEATLRARECRCPCGCKLPACGVHACMRIVWWACPSCTSFDGSPAWSCCCVLRRSMPGC